MLVPCNSNIKTSTQQLALASAVATAIETATALMRRSEGDGEVRPPPLFELLLYSSIRITNMLYSSIRITSML
jgi:hypothetical protein